MIKFLRCIQVSLDNSRRSDHSIRTFYTKLLNFRHALNIQLQVTFQTFSPRKTFPGEENYCRFVSNKALTLKNTSLIMALPHKRSRSKPIFEKNQVKRTFITSASRSSIFVESGSSLWRLTSNRSVLAASSGCFTSTDMIVSPQSTAQFVVVSRQRRAL